MKVLKIKNQLKPYYLILGAGQKISTESNILGESIVITFLNKEYSIEDFNINGRVSLEESLQQLIDFLVDDKRNYMEI